MVSAVGKQCSKDTEARLSLPCPTVLCLRSAVQWPTECPLWFSAPTLILSLLSSVLATSLHLLVLPGGCRDLLRLDTVKESPIPPTG